MLVKLHRLVAFALLYAITLPLAALRGADDPATQPAGPTTAPATVPATAPAAEPDFHVDLRSTLTYLASDELAGRYIGTPGLQKAGDLIAEDFARLGLKPLPGLDGCFQPFSMIAGATIDPATSLTIAGVTPKLDDGFIPAGFTGEGTFDAPVAFVGYGISDKDRGYDDYAGIDVKGKVVLMLRYEPEDAAGKSAFSKSGGWSEDAGFNSKMRTAIDHGAAAALFVNPPNEKDADHLMPFVRMSMGKKFSLPVMQVSQDVASAAMRAGGGDDLVTVETAIDKSLKPHSFALNDVTARGNVTLKKNLKPVRNVAAWPPGKGEHADEYVVIGAHYDHLGRGGPGSLAPLSHEIHHGADDNASGTVAMLAIADDQAHSPPPQRSLIFIAFTAEEEGLIGSQYFVEHCPVPLEKIAYMVNLDMVGRVRGSRIEVGGSGTAADLQKVLEESDKDLPLKLGVSAVGGKGGMGPSDHMSFALKKIPVIFFFSGMHRDYHRPTDTSDKVNFWGIDQTVHLTDRVVRDLAALPREQYVSAFDSAGMAHMGGGGGGNGASLGVIPDYSSDDAAIHGVRISGTMDGTAAEKAGLKAGDVIVKFGKHPIENLEDLAEAISNSRPGDKVHLVVNRGGATVEMDAVLGERK